jgi:hypothetical protein
MRVVQVSETSLPELQGRALGKRSRLNWLLQGARFVPRFRSSLSTADLLATTHMEPLGPYVGEGPANLRPAAVACSGWVGETLVASRAAVVVPLRARGASLVGAQLVELPVSDLGPTLEQQVELGRHVLETLRRAGVRWVYATPGPQWGEGLLAALGLTPLGEAVERSFPLGLGGIGAVVGKLNPGAVFGPNPLRRLATVARGVRNKLIEVELDGVWLEDVERMASSTSAGDALALARTPAYLAWRYRDAPGRSYRLLVLRRQAGVGADAAVIVEPFALDGGRFGIRILEHWTRARDLAALTWLLGEVALWSLAEQASQLRAVAVGGTAQERLLLAVAAVRRTQSLPFYWRSLAGDDDPAPDAGALALQAGDLLGF